MPKQCVVGFPAIGHRHRRWTTAAMVLMLVCCTHLGFASPVVANPAPDLAAAVASARSETSCNPLRPDPTVEHAADVYNRMSEDYLGFTGVRVPGGETAPGDHVDPMPGLKTLGYNATGGSLLQGSHRTQARAIEAAILEGEAWHVFEDCSFTEFGTSLRRSERTGFYLAAVVLAKT